MTENKNCSRCLSTTLSENDFGVNKYNEYFKTCNDCREYSNQKKANNREYINEQAKEYYKENREDKIKQSLKWRAENIDRLKTKIECECGGRFQYRQKSEHNKTHKHQKYITSITVI